MALDPTYPEIEHASFKKKKGVEFYDDVEEAIPTEILEPREKIVDLRMHVDSDHDEDKVTR